VLGKRDVHLQGNKDIFLLVAILFFFIYAYFYKVCWRCREQSNKSKEVDDAFAGGKMSLWGVLECAICGHNWDRDVNAANNIRYLELLEYDGADRPDVFSRRMEDETSDLQSLLNIMDHSIDVNIGVDPMELDDPIEANDPMEVDDQVASSL
jgi:hypothetical protein